MKSVQTQSVLPQKAVQESLYESDFYAWTQTQVALIQSGQWTDIDVQNLVEEIESLGKQHRREMRSRLTVLLAHLLKWEYQPGKRYGSWRATIRVQRRDLLRLLKESPSLKPYIEDATLSAYTDARDLAISETGLADATFPEVCGYSWAQVVDMQFFPGDASDLVD